MTVKGPLNTRSTLSMTKLQLVTLRNYLRPLTTVSMQPTPRITNVSSATTTAKRKLLFPPGSLGELNGSLDSNLALTGELRFLSQKRFDVTFDEFKKH